MLTTRIAEDPSGIRRSTDRQRVVRPVSQLAYTRAKCDTHESRNYPGAYEQILKILGPNSHTIPRDD